jgi:hypothetical protein
LPSKRVKSELSGPMREVVYIFEREGERGGGCWWLVLACGHAVARKRVMPSVGTMFRPLEEKLAPKRCQCHSCGYGHEKIDPWVMIKAFGGQTP